MRIYRSLDRLILTWACVVFFAHIALAQNLPGMKEEIYSKFKCCPCNVSFDRCTCQEAKEMKAYIDALLDSGVTKEDIFYKVAKKFSLKVILDERIKSDIKQRLIKEAGQKRSEIVLDTTSFDFGSVSKRQGKISKIFKLSNKGNAPLIIKNMKTSCPCASVSLSVDKNKSPYFGTSGASEGWQVEIKPGKMGELEFMVDLASPHVKVGKMLREARIISNDPIYPELSIRIAAEVKD